MATYVTLTVPVEDIIGADYDPRRTAVYLETNTPNSLIVVDGTTIRAGGRREKIGTSGTVEFPNLVATNSASNPTTFAYRVQIVYTPVGSREQKVWTSSDFSLTTSANLAAISEAFDGLAISATWQSNFRDEMEEIAGLTGEDAAIANRINTPGSDTELALADYVSAGVELETETGGAVWKVGPTTVNVRSYGIDPANSASANDTALANIFTDYTGAVSIAFPDTGTLNFSAPLPARNHLQISGRGRQTILNWTSGNMLAVSGSTLMQSAVFRDLQITNSGTATHLIDIAGTGGFIHSTFERCFIKPGVNGASIFKSDTTNLFGLAIRDCLLHRLQTATVPAIDIIGQSGGGTNSINVEGGEWHSNLCNSTPFFRLNTSSASPVINLTFEKIVGEQNQGGLIHIGGATVVRVKNVIDYDATAYADDLFRFATGSGGATSNCVDIDMSGSYGSATVAGGKAHVRISSGTGHRVGWIPKNASQEGTVVVTPTKGVTIRRSGIETPPYEAIAALPVTMTLDQHTVIVGATGTITLPANAPAGQRFVVKAVAGGGCTVSGNGLNIDGAATRVLAQYDTLNVVSNGTSWLRL